MDTVEGYAGEKEIITRFGLEIRDETTFTVSRRRWLDLVSSDTNLISALRPNEGDWIYMPTVQRLLEISFVDKDDPFFQVNNLPVYKLYCRTVEYSSEILDTGIDTIDALETKYSTDALGWQFSGEVASDTFINENMALEDGTGFVDLEAATDTGYLVGEDYYGFDSVLTEASHAGYSFFIINEDYNITTLDAQSDNEWITDAVSTALPGTSDPVLDFTERNPFGEPTENT